MRLLPLLALLPLLSLSWDVLFVNVVAGRSHQTVAVYTANLLAEHGHGVTYLSTNIPKSLRSEIRKVTLEENERIGNDLLKHVDDPDTTMFKVLDKAKKMLYLCESFFQDPFVQDLLERRPKFDAMIVFGGLFDSCGFALAHKLEIPGRIVQMPAPATFPAQIIGYGLPIYHSSVNHDGMSYLDNEEVKASALLRVKNVFWISLIGIFEDIVQRWIIGPAIYKYVPDYPGYLETFKEVGLVLMHYHPMTDTPVPFGPGVVPLAGSLCSDYNPGLFSKELAEWLDGADKGFVYLSFGSLIDTLRDVEYEILIGAFSRLPYRVVWKSKFEIPNLPVNVKTFKWLPQISLLRHPNIKLFINHGGYASKVEAMCGGVPMLVIPRVAFDQYYAADQIVKRGLGDKIVALANSTSDEVYNKVMGISGGSAVAASKSLQRHVLATRTTPDQLLGYIDIVISGRKLLPGYQPVWEYFYLDIILTPIIAVYVVKFTIRFIKQRF